MKAESKRYHDNDIKFRKIAKKSINKEPLLGPISVSYRFVFEL